MFHELTISAASSLVDILKPLIAMLTGSRIRSLGPTTINGLRKLRSICKR